MHTPHRFRVREFAASLDPGALSVCEALENADALPRDLAQTFAEFHGSNPRSPLTARQVVEALAGHYLAECYRRDPKELYRVIGVKF